MLISLTRLKNSEVSGNPTTLLIVVLISMHLLKGAKVVANIRSSTNAALERAGALSIGNEQWISSVEYDYS